MLSSIGIQTCSGNHSLLAAKPIGNKIFTTPKSPSICSYQKPRALSIWASESATEKLKVVVKAVERPRLVLKFIWMEKNIGIAIDQHIPGGHGTIPVTPYYFWPRKDAWEELKLMMQTKPWISDKQMVTLLNQATDIINLWQQTGGGGL